MSLHGPYDLYASPCRRSTAVTAALFSVSNLSSSRLYGGAAAAAAAARAGGSGLSWGPSRSPGGGPLLSGVGPVGLRSRVTGSRSYGAASLSGSGDGELSQSAMLLVNSEYKASKTSEKEQLQSLNDRFVGYIERVHELEEAKRLLEAEVALLRQRQAGPSRLGELYDAEMRDLRALVEELSHDKTGLQLERDQLEVEAQRLQERAEQESRQRLDAEAAAKALRRDVENAALVRSDLEKRVETLLDELAFQQKVHDEEVAELQAAVQAAHVSVEVDVSKPDLTLALREIRSQYESLAVQNLQTADEWYKSKFANLSEAASRNHDAIRAAKEELGEYRRQLQARTVEVEAMRSANEALERQLQDMEERYGGEVAAFQENIEQLEEELRCTKVDMSRHLRDYQDLLNVKMALDIEIAAYRKLLEGEETRFGGSSIADRTCTSFSFSSSRSPFPTSVLLHRKTEEREESVKNPPAKASNKESGVAAVSSPKKKSPAEEKPLRARENKDSPKPSPSSKQKLEGEEKE